MVHVHRAEFEIEHEPQRVVADLQAEEIILRIEQIAQRYFGQIVARASLTDSSAGAEGAPAGAAATPAPT